jgi:hypothetical protein
MVGNRFSSNALALAVIVGAATLSFATALRAPLLFDAYSHVANASRECFAEVMGAFYKHPLKGDFFFRPVGILSYWMDFQWARFDPFKWNLWNLGVHVVTSILVYLLARQLWQRPMVAMISALTFALHGSRPEVVSWVAARFDLLAALFGVLSLVALNEYLDSTEKRAWGWYALSVGSLVSALLSKESAYCVPLLVVCLVAFRESSEKRKIIRAAGVFAFTAAVVFAYRFWVLGGIGGYRTEEGSATVLRFNAIRTARALFFREWAFLLFPINWSANMGVGIKVTAAVVLPMLCGVLLWVRPPRRQVLGCLCLVIAASLPVQHLLLLSQDLSGARVLYLPTLGISLLWGFLLQGCVRRSHSVILAMALLGSQVVMLEHNLSIWKDAAFLSQRTCRGLGERLEGTGRRAVVMGLPAVWHGVYFLRNGFPECVAMNSRAEAGRIDVRADLPGDSRNTAVFVWDNKSGYLEEKSGR